MRNHIIIFSFHFYIFKNRLCCFAQPVLSQIAVSLKKHTENRSFFTKSIICIGIYFCHMLLVTVSKMCYTGVQTKSSAERIRIMAKRVDLLQGNIMTTLVQLALPIMGTALIQMAYNLVDMVWIGKLGSGAVAAVGTAGLLMWLSNGFTVLSRMGGQVHTAQKLGAGDPEEAGKYAQNAIQMGALLSIGYSAVMLIACRPLIGFFRLNDPAVVESAVQYLSIVSLGILASFLNQMFTALITTTGNSRTPFYFMTIGLVFNIVLDPLLIFGLGPIPSMKAAGAAWATTIAQWLVSILFLLYIRRDDHLFCYVRLFGKMDKECCVSIVKLGLPSALQNCIFPLISMVIARQVASFGDAAVAVQKVGSQIESVSWMISDGFSVAINSFVAQNYGAHNFSRTGRGYRAAMISMTVWGIFCSLLLILCGGWLFQLFITEPDVVPMGISYLTILGFSQMFMCWEGVNTGAYCGFGKTLPPSIVGIVFTAARIPAALILSSTSLGLDGIWWSLSISSVCKGTLLTLLFWRFLRHKLKEVPESLSQVTI